MHGTEGGIVGLEELLSLVPGSEWSWLILEFDGIMLGPSAGSSYAELREKLKSSPQGCVMSWAQVREFASGVRQFFDLLLVAARDRRQLDSERLAAEDYAGLPLVLTASDSTWWTVEVDDETETECGLAEKIRIRYGAKAE
ncbi:hypothetical protein ACIRST_32275 [Kitasatospora sp. NPDC101447]|uniref:hypothetical protein n=1 Tax=Kitasatospora sp. NPDC101447 TaxID=3364102 RepID=UPI00381B3907